MATIDCGVEMSKFHAEDVTLSKTDQDEMRSRRDAGRTRLRTGLNQKGHAQPCEVVSQGSYAMRTMTQDAVCDYDIDDGAYFLAGDLTDADGKPLTPKAARERVCEALQWDGRLKHEAYVKTNCVRQLYPEGYHIDIPVYRVVSTTDDDENTVEQYEHASGEEWVESDARAVTRWFNDIVGELNSGQPDGSQMRRVTKLTKKFARSRSNWKKSTTSGICITKLIVDHFVAVEGRDDEALRKTWTAIKQALLGSLRIEHPVLAGTNLTEEDDAEVAFFRSCLSEALTTLEQLDSEDCTRANARAVWDSVFNTTFFSDCPSDDNGPSGGNRAPFVVTSGETTRRDDGGRRFG